ncbi:anthranilate synthase component 1 [Geomicrobium halophilum]|uniref:Anthranilate synthase component 1 n=1 Tax=Geomicrobium halophilum TaxID=549000 RepID=A0A841PJT1_9BACL|nr:anthranilate synthase component I [Geomicrobium halophilum]MBB6449040.1 anthranilate synthase component 1 [Geomicrobium halophilum]
MATSFDSFVEETNDYRLVPVIKRIFADTTTPIQIFQQLNEDAVCLLEGNDHTSEWSRYSFVGLHAAYELKESDNGFELTTSDGETVVNAADVQTAFQRTFETLKPSPAAESDVPFPGGAVGVIPYDAVRHQEKTIKLDKGITPDPVHFLFCETMIAFDHKQSTMTIVHYKDCRDKEAEDVYKEALDYIDGLIMRMEERVAVNFSNEMPERKEPNFAKVHSNYTKSEFQDAVNKIKAYIRQGDVFQTVISQRFEAEIETSAFMIYRVLRRLNPSPYMFFLKLGEKEIVGSSPERLVEVKNGKVEVHPIAGTRKRGNSAEEDDELAEEMLASPKERAEHQMLIDLARNDVGRVARYGTVQTPKFMEVGKFSHVMHLVSKVSGELQRDVPPLTALLSGFPAGTLSGAPKVRAMEILQELEPTPRGIYAGGIGYIAYNGHIDSCIAIRTMVIENNKVRVQAGAGVVADSVPEEEYEETINKAAALFSAIETAEEMSVEEMRKDDQKRIEVSD